MNTIKFDKKNVKMVAHRGVSGLECENTCAAFVAAGNRSYFGIETDTHPTADGQFIVIHDRSAERVSGVAVNVEEVNFSELADIRLYDMQEGLTRSDLAIPKLEEYIRICKRYEKVAVLELKHAMTAETCAGIVKTIESLDYLEKTIFIAFDAQNCIEIRKLLPNATIQFLTKLWDDSILDMLLEYHFDLDIYYKSVTQELIDTLHANGLEINCWTVNEPECGETLAAMGVDYITTNILE